MSPRKLFLPLLVGLGLAILNHSASAQLLYNVAVDTSKLNPASTYYAEFTLSDGSVVNPGTPTTNNNVTLTSFTLGGGVLGSVLPPFGDASGNMNSFVYLTDGDPGGVADFAQGFTPGTALDFNVNMTTVVNAGPVPDVFTMYIFDSGFNYLPTNAPSDTPDAFFRVNITSSSLNISDVLTFGNTTYPVPPPVITSLGGPAGVATPEPGGVTLIMGCMLLIGLLALKRRRRTNHIAAIVTLSMLAMFTFHAQAQNAPAHGAPAQAAPPQGIRIGNVYIPSSSIGLPGDGFARMHTNYQIYLNPNFGLPGVFGPDTAPPPGLSPFNSNPFTPANLQQLYDIPSNGGSQIIAVVDAYHDPTSLSDFNTFSSTFGLPQETSSSATASTNKVFQVLYAAGTQPGVDPAGPTGWSIEESLDIEWAHAMAPNAKIILVECASNTGQNLLNGVAAVTGYQDGNGHTVKEISNSWGGAEFAGESSYDTYFDSTSAAFFCSAGDGGAPAQWPSASVYVVSAGGTTLNVNGSNQFISETAWNDGGGGPSSQNARPFYQNVISSIVMAARGTPDIAYDADPSTGVYVLDTYAGGWYEVGGTSLSAPALAGIANSAATAENGFPAGSQALLANIYTNYANFYTGSPGDVFRDITSGNNGYAATTGWDFDTGVGSCIGLPGMWDIGTPTANSQSVNVAHNSGGVAITLTGSDPDSPALPLVFNGGTPPSHGTLSGTVPNVSYTPDANYHGADSFTFMVTNSYSLPTSPAITDLFYNSTPATVTISVAVGTPTANAQSVNVGFNTATAITLTGSDSDTPSLPITYTISTNPAHGTLSGSTPNISYTPNAGYHGTDSFTFTANNGTNTSPAATVTLTIAAGVPTANPQSATTNQDTSTSITLTGSDPDSPALPLTYSIATSPAHGTLTGAAPNVTYVPNAGYYGSDSFTFKVNNGINTSTAATVNLTVIQTAFDVSGQITITRGPFLVSRATGDYEQVLTLTNTGASINGPISVILGSLANATLANATGITVTISPAGRAYLNAAVSSLASGASTTVELLFAKTGSGTITYTTQVIAGPGSR